ncbi:MAG TPA: ATP synthase F0 subunit B, partial [Nitrospira sp.]|nr:ATP synthase F0 subunit B [Nitrospira sp.]
MNDIGLQPDPEEDRVQVDGTTFLLEIINFLVLVWILTRLLYRPVLNAIADRQAQIRKSVSEAEQMRQEAQALREEYEQRQTRWIQETETARSSMLKEVNAERDRLLSQLQSSLREEREKAEALERQRLAELGGQTDRQAAELASTFAAR